MEFTDSQIYFINDSIRRALREEEKFIKYWTDLAQKENDLEMIIFNPNSDESTKPHESGKDSILNAK